MQRLCQSVLAFGGLAEYRHFLPTGHRRAPKIAVFDNFEPKGYDYNEQGLY
jgi:hypothetical protein